MTLGRSSSWRIVVSFGAIWMAMSGCGHSEDAWQAKVREGDDLRTQLAADQAQRQKAKAELSEADAKVEQLKQQLKTAGVDMGNLNANLEQQARAIEEYRRRAEQIDVTRRRFEAFRSKLAALTKLGLNVTVRNNRMVLQLSGDVLFESERETLKRDGRDILGKVAEVIRNDPTLASRTFQVAGHTDSAKRAGGPFKDNWGLSLMRAREVLAFLVKSTDKGGGGLNAVRWSAAGYGDTDPLKSNDTPEGKQANRRCELVFVPNVEEMLDLRDLTR